MSVWNEYSADYRAEEIKEIYRAAYAGECVSVVGLSGSGKSNLLDFIASRPELTSQYPRFVFVDCNRIAKATSESFFRLVYEALGLYKNPDSEEISDNHWLIELDEALKHIISSEKNICLLLERFDILIHWQDFNIVTSNLQALRVTQKYQLTFVTATRQPLDNQTELAELFFSHILWLGLLSKSDALWSARRDMVRLGKTRKCTWNSQSLEKLVELSWGYPSLLRASCVAYAEGASLTLNEIRGHPSVERRVREFWQDEPEEEAVRRCGLEAHSLLGVRAKA